MDINALEKKLTETMTEHLELKGALLYTSNRVKSLDFKIKTLSELVIETAGKDEAKEVLERVAENTIENILGSEILGELGFLPNTEEEKEKLKTFLKTNVKGI